MQNPLASLTHRERFGLAVAVSVLTLFGIGGTLWRSSAAPLQPAAVFPAKERLRASPSASRASPSASPAPLASPTPKLAAPLVVYVSGAVKKPGVYSLPPGARLHQAIQKAGGFRSGAQEDALNLAGFLQDADQLHVPLKQQTPPLPQVVSVPPSAQQARGRVLGRALPVALDPTTTTHASGSGGKLHSPSEGKVKLNGAALDDLQRLPGVGPSTAQSILDYRQQHGNFQELEELKEVRGIGEKKFAKMEPFLTL